MAVAIKTELIFKLSGKIKNSSGKSQKDNRKKEYDKTGNSNLLEINKHASNLFESKYDS